MKIVNEDGKLTLIGSTRDITEQRKQEKKLKRKSEERLFDRAFIIRCMGKNVLTNI